MAARSSILRGEYHGQRSLAATVHGISKESDVTERLTHTLVRLGDSLIFLGFWGL